MPQSLMNPVTCVFFRIITFALGLNLYLELKEFRTIEIILVCFICQYNIFVPGLLWAQKPKM